MNLSRPRFTCLAAGLAVSMTLQLAPLSARADNPAPAQTSEQLANEAYDLHAQGKYSEAIAAYFKAYELSPAAAILFNIATIYDRKLNERELAANFYRRFLLAPDADPSLVKKATERLAAMKHDAEEEAKKKQAEAPPPVSDAAAHAASTTPAAGTAPPPEVPGPYWTGARTAGVVIGVLGVLGVGTSFGLGLAAKSKNDAANGVCNGAVCTTAQGVSDAKTAGDFATGANVAMIAGAAVLVAGVVIVLVVPRGKATSQTGQVTFGPMIGSSEAGMTVHGTF